MTGSTRHKWAKPMRFQFKTERSCIRCELVRVTRHDNPSGLPWIEWWRDLEQIHHAATPPCDARLERETVPDLEVTA
jgi:hypothetical protein